VHRLIVLQKHHEDGEEIYTTLRGARKYNAAPFLWGIRKIAKGDINRIVTTA